MSDMELQMRTMQYSPEADLSAYLSEDAFRTSPEAMHNTESAVAALAAHTTFFQGLTAEEDDDEDESPNDVLLRLLKEVRAVDSDEDDENGGDGIERSSDENAAGARFSVTDGSTAKGFAVPYSGLVRPPAATAAAAAMHAGFTVEGNVSYSSTTSLPPPPPPPPAYGTPSTAPRSPYANCYTGIPNLTATPGSTKPPPPTFAEAMATSHGTPASLVGARPSPSLDRSPLVAQYAAPMPAAPQETVLLRNCNGVFLLQPVVKATPPYTPPASTTSPPVSPLPRYSLPPAASLAGANSSTTSNNNFLGSSMAQTGGGQRVAAGAAEPPHYGPYGAAGGAGGGSPFIATAAPFVSAVSSVRGTPSFLAAAPPPYTGGL